MPVFVLPLIVVVPRSTTAIIFQSKDLTFWRVSKPISFHFERIQSPVMNFEVRLAWVNLWWLRKWACIFCFRGWQTCAGHVFRSPFIAGTKCINNCTAVFFKCILTCGMKKFLSFTSRMSKSKVLSKAYCICAWYMPFFLHVCRANKQSPVLYPLRVDDRFIESVIFCH